VAVIKRIAIKVAAKRKTGKLLRAEWAKWSVVQKLCPNLGCKWARCVQKSKKREFFRMCFLLEQVQRLKNIELGCPHPSSGWAAQSIQGKFHSESDCWCLSISHANILVPHW
jgi:hypothetical protein